MPAVGYTAAAAQAMQRKRDETTSRALLNLGNLKEFYPHDLREHLLAGRPLLKRGL